MNEGYWGNYRTGQIFLIDEHEQWIRRGNNASKLGVSIAVQKRFKDFIVREDRNPFLLFIFANSPVMRFRGHGSDVTMEFACSDWEKPLALVLKWGEANAGGLLWLIIVNFASNEAIQSNWESFKLGKPVPVRLNQ
jgi:hypothetical protein